MMMFVICQNEIDVDLLEAEELFEELATREKIKGTTPTPRLLDCVAEWLRDLGVVDVTRSIAWQVWWSIYERIEQIRKESTSDADLAYWFGVNPFGLSVEQKIGLLANLNRVKAQAILHAGNFSSTDYEYIYAVTLAATGDKKQADQAKATALERFVDQEIARKRQ